MRFYHYLTLLVALTISVCAAYYSIVGLAAIFAASVIPVIIMGTVLELAKITGAIWLKLFWREAAWWLKFYLIPAIAVLMLITSMGIFGFLSKAHIEQTAKAGQSVQQIEQIDSLIDREKALIERASVQIETLRNSSNNRDTEVQDQITLEQQRIDSAYDRIEPSVQEQQTIIDRELEKRTREINNLQAQYDAVQTELSDLRTALAAGDIRKAQGIVGVRQDGALGPNTENAIDQFRTRKEQDSDSIQADIEAAQSRPNPQIDAAREEIKRLRSTAEQQISNSNQLIQRLREQVGQTDFEEVQEKIVQQELLIDQSNEKIDQLIEQKYTLEAEYRKLEAEVGPIKYVAELIYGDTDQDLLEQSVRWMILLLVAVFDPLAVILTLAAISGLTVMSKPKQNRNSSDIQKTTDEPDNNEVDNEVDNEVVDNQIEQIAEEHNQQVQQLLAEKSALMTRIDQQDKTAHNKLVDAENTIKTLKQELADKTAYIKQLTSAPLESTSETQDNNLELLDIGTASVGTTWPTDPVKHDLFFKTDSNVLYRWNGRKWIEEDKGSVDLDLSYDYDFIKWLTSEVKKGKTSYNELTDLQKNQVKAYILNHGRKQQ